MADPILAAALRAQSGDLDDFCEGPSAPQSPVASGWSSLFSPSYWTRRAEETLKKLIERHLLKPHEDDHPLPPPTHAPFVHSNSAPSFSAASPSGASSSAISHSSLALSSPSVSKTWPQAIPTAQAAISRSPVPPSSLSRSVSLSEVRETGVNRPNARLRPPLKTGTSWTRLGPYFASKSKAVSVSDSESQMSDTSARLPTHTSGTDDGTTTFDDISEDIDEELVPGSFEDSDSAPPLASASASSASSSFRRERTRSNSGSGFLPGLGASPTAGGGGGGGGGGKSQRKLMRRGSALRKRTKRPLSLSIFGCSMTDPRKGSNGEDAFFVSRRRNTCGVADGVGAWIEQGIDSGVYSRTLVSYIKKGCERYRLHDPLEMLKFAYDRITDDGIQGSTTMCLLTLQPSSSIICACNLGDSGFLVARGGQLILRSAPQQHGPNHPYQLGANRDVPEDSDLLKFSVHPGDVIVLGTDGLFDNLHVDEILTFIHTLTAKRLKENLMPPASPKSFSRELAELLLHAAVEASADPEKYCPINQQKSTAQPLGGKLDDITVMVAQVVEG